MSDRIGLPQRRRGAIGRDRDDERRTVDDRTELEVAEFRPVDHVDGHTCGAGRRRECRSFGAVRNRTDSKRGTIEVIGLPPPQIER